MEPQERAERFLESIPYLMLEAPAAELQDRLVGSLGEAIQEERNAIIAMMEDKCRTWDHPMKEAVETLVACIRARK